METASFSSSTCALHSLAGYPGSRKHHLPLPLPHLQSAFLRNTNKINTPKPWPLGECRHLLQSRSPGVLRSPYPYTLSVIPSNYELLERRRKTNSVIMMFCSSLSVGVADASPFEFSGTFKWTIRARSKSLASRSSRWHQSMISPCRIMSVSCRGRSGDSSANEFGPYPWDPVWNTPENEAIEWIQDDIVTLFTTDGLIQIGGSLIPHQPSAAERRQLRGRGPYRFRRFREEDYMDPKQGLCLGASFDIVATNGLDMGRRFCVFGFCRSIEMLSDVVEDTVLEQGGEVMVAAKGGNGGLNEKLSMKVAVPLLWGVPPAVDLLNYAIRCGGGIVEKICCQWEFL